jgi:hypothetical protein
MNDYKLCAGKKQKGGPDQGGANHLHDDRLARVNGLENCMSKTDPVEAPRPEKFTYFKTFFPPPNDFSSESFIEAMDDQRRICTTRRQESGWKQDKLSSIHVYVSKPAESIPVIYHFLSLSMRRVLASLNDSTT